MGRINSALEREILNQRAHWFNWSPVLLAFGIGAYFKLPNEPDFSHYILISFFTAFVGGVFHFSTITNRVILGAILIFSIGFCAAAFRSNQVSAPVLKYRYYGPIEGRVVDIDKSSSDALRITLDKVKMGKISSGRTPHRIRLSLLAKGSDQNFDPGSIIQTTAFMMPPQSPVEPDGFDFRRHAWFLKLGAVGYTRKRVRLLQPAAETLDLKLFQYRMKFSRRLQNNLPKRTSGFAAAIMTGDRSGIKQEHVSALRRSNLAHLLAISGLHMGLLVGVIFTALRWILTSLPFFILRSKAKKIAALGALLFAFVYLGLSGFNIATQRAFLMVSLMLCAILFNRRALSLRAVALAAWLILIYRPESLLSAGFQMSFAATFALVISFQWINNWRQGRPKKWFSPILTVILTSLIAGLATAPIAAAHFNQIVHYGLIANILSVPVMGALVAPGAILSVSLMPFGVEIIGLWIVDIGLGWILKVATFFANQENAVSGIVMPETWILALGMVAVLQFSLWQGRLRILGAFGIFAAGLFWSQTQRPDILIADRGALVGVMTSEGRAISKPKGAGFVARIWLENDGDKINQSDAHDRWKNQRSPFVFHHWSKRTAAKTVHCKSNEIHISIVPQNIIGNCIIYNLKDLEKTGSLAIWQDASGKIEKASVTLNKQKTRLWSPPRWRRFNG